MSRATRASVRRIGASGTRTSKARPTSQPDRIHAGSADTARRSSRSPSFNRSVPNAGIADLRVVRDVAHLVLLVALDPLACVHDLDRKQILVLLHAVHGLPVRCRQCDRRISGTEVFDRAPDLTDQRLARPRRRRRATGRDRDVRRSPLHPVAARAVDARKTSGRSGRCRVAGRSGRARRACAGTPESATPRRRTRGLAGISVPGTPVRSVLNSPSSVRPEAHTCVRSGARTPWRPCRGNPRSARGTVPCRLDGVRVAVERVLRRQILSRRQTAPITHAIATISTTHVPLMRDPSSRTKRLLVMRAIVTPFDRPDAVLGGSAFTLNGRNRRIGGMQKTLIAACSVALSPLLLLAQAPAGQQGARGCARPRRPASACRAISRTIPRR